MTVARKFERNKWLHTGGVSTGARVFCQSARAQPEHYVEAKEALAVNACNHAQPKALVVKRHVHFRTAVVTFLWHGVGTVVIMTAARCLHCKGQAVVSCTQMPLL